MAANYGYSVVVWAIVSVVCLQAVRFIAAGVCNPLRHVPGPWHTRFSSLSLKFATLAGRRVHHVHTLHQRYGYYVRLSPTEVGVMDSAGFKRIHALHSGFNKTAWYTDMVTMERPGVFSMAGGKPHANRRRLLSRPFSKSYLRQVWEPTVRQHVCLAVERMVEEAQLQSEGKVDVLKWWTFMASDVSAHLMFGESFNTLESGRVSNYIRLLQNALKGGGIGAEFPWLRSVGKRIPSRILQETFNADAQLMKYGEVAVARMKLADGSGNIFANMLKQSEKGEQLDEKDVQVEATNLIVAGTDTTAITLTYLVWAVLLRPNLQSALVAEVRSLPDGYTDADLETLPLLTAVIEETLRLFGAAPGGLPRSVPAPGAEIGGFWFPERTTLTTQSYSLHRDPSMFPDPERFEPRRFMKDDQLYVSDAAKAVFSPFGAGSRTCLGVHLAYMELRYGAVEFFRRCPHASLASDSTEESMEMENYFLVAPTLHRCNVIVR